MNLTTMLWALCRLLLDGHPPLKSFSGVVAKLIDSKRLSSLTKFGASLSPRSVARSFLLSLLTVVDGSSRVFAKKFCSFLLVERFFLRL